MVSIDFWDEAQLRETFKPFMVDYYLFLIKGEDMTKQKFVVVIEKDEDGQYIGTVPNIKGCHSYGKTLDELLKNIEEAIEANLEALKAENRAIPFSNFSGIQEIEIEVK